MALQRITRTGIRLMMCECLEWLMKGDRYIVFIQVIVFEKKRHELYFCKKPRWTSEYCFFFVAVLAHEHCFSIHFFGSAYEAQIRRTSIFKISICRFCHNFVHISYSFLPSFSILHTNQMASLEAQALRVCLLSRSSKGLPLITSAYCLEKI